jgi:tRNA nucleotidyltransferase (CCA-adding enzyme)
MLVDLDLEVFGLDAPRLEEVAGRLFPLDWVGRSFGVYKLKGIPVDLSLPRTESVTGLRHRDFEVCIDPSLPIERAAVRRDFTFNAIYLDPLEGRIEDPCGGLEDIRKRLLRHASAQFVEDPLRVMRAMQFVSRFEMDCCPETLQLCRNLHWDHLPQERLFGEFEKLLLQGVDLRKGLNFLRDCGWIAAFPELEGMVGCAQDPGWHPEGDVWTHTCLAMNAFAHRRVHSPKEDLVVGLAVLCHDMGKPRTSAWSDGRIRSPGHEHAGVPLAEAFLSRITREAFLLESVPPLVREHMVLRALHLGKAGDAAIRRLSLRVPSIEWLARVCQADREGRADPWVALPFPEGDWIRERVAALRMPGGKVEPLVRGRDLIDLGVHPGRAMGEVLKALFEVQLDGGFEDCASGLKYAREHLLDPRPEP